MHVFVNIDSLEATYYVSDNPEPFEGYYLHFTSTDQDRIEQCVWLLDNANFSELDIDTLISEFSIA